MAKNANKRQKQQWDSPMTLSMKFFLAGCVAELYLLIVRRYYTNGTAIQMIQWYDTYLGLLTWIGAAVFALGAAMFLQKKVPALRVPGVYIGGLGAFVAIANQLVLWRMTLLSLLTVVVPLVILMVLLWDLYDRECALGLTLLGAALVGVWTVRRSPVFTPIMRTIVVVLMALIALTLLLAKLNLLHKLHKLLPANADRTPIYVCGAFAEVGLASAFLGSTGTFYAMWLLVFVSFALAVYYTVKQL